jgi:RNA polymerase sigma-70 factor (ECF subfamily)
VPGSELSPAQAWDEHHLDGDVQPALAALPPDYRSAVVLCDYEGFSYEEIAAALGVKLGRDLSHVPGPQHSPHGPLVPVRTAPD